MFQRLELRALRASSWASCKTMEILSSWCWRVWVNSTPEYLISVMIGNSWLTVRMSCWALGLHKHAFRVIVISNLSSSVAISPANKSAIVVAERGWYDDEEVEEDDDDEVELFDYHNWVCPCVYMRR
ncbi:hypothetical protein HanPI659440_Chr02g0043051 [Helianthus annuus]|nr:hypothetical protein HanPI659440_Chr02g0043051 [Helianthus annuus]